MGDRLRLAVGIMGNASSLLLYAAPILTFTRVIRKRSTEEFSCIPYIVALSNCLLYTWYGLPVVSYKWENFPVITINGLGIILELSFIFIYLCLVKKFADKALYHNDELSVLWLAYGLLSHDLLLASPNLVGLPLGILQLGLYCKYRKRGIIEEEPSKWDLEHNNLQEKPKHIQLSMNEDINGKI
ncbi:hypothetical protein GOBAR_DD31995 [Gossypium barbadense]|nr:hypothetical protein GOBAR_DD31995 [Gossypium barbadense]